MQTQADNLKTILREEADFNLSWTDGRRGSATELVQPDYIERRLLSAAKLQRFADEIERLQSIEAAARNLVKVKGRYHTEQAFKALAELLAETKAGTASDGQHSPPNTAPHRPNHSRRSAS